MNSHTNLQDPTFIAQHAKLRDALKGKGLGSYFANQTATNILTGNVTKKTLARLLEALSD